MKKILRTMFGALALTLTCAGIAGADQLDDIVSRGKIMIATDLAVPPFGIQNAQQEPDGYDVQVGKMLASDLGVELEIVPVTGANRIPYLQTGRVDLVISTFSLTPERAKAVSFSSPYGSIASVIFAPASVVIETAADLAGKKIGVARGTTNEGDLLKIAPEGTDVIRFDDDAAGMSALVAGQVDAFVTGESILISLAERFPERGFETKMVLRTSLMGIGVRRTDPGLLQWVNSWVLFRKNTGDLARMYKEWLKVDLPDLPAL